MRKVCIDVSEKEYNYIMFTTKRKRMTITKYLTRLIQEDIKRERQNEIRDFTYKKIIEG